MWSSEASEHCSCCSPLAHPSVVKPSTWVRSGGGLARVIGPVCVTELRGDADRDTPFAMELRRSTSKHCLHGLGSSNKARTCSSFVGAIAPGSSNEARTDVPTRFEDVFSLRAELQSLCLGTRCLREHALNPREKNLRQVAATFEV
jgi:hypothetical protein